MKVQKSSSHYQEKLGLMAQWHDLVTCPNCHKPNDLVNGDDDSIIAQAIFNDDWDKLQGLEVCCNYCEHEFEINGCL